MRRSLLLALLLLPGSGRGAPLPRTGDYLDVAYIQALQKTLSPLRATQLVASAHMPQLVSVQPQGSARRFALSWNWQNGTFLAVLQRNGVLRRELAWGADPGIALRLTGADGFCLTPQAGHEHCYRYVRDASAFITRAVLVGSYTDRQGAAYRFDADGTAHFPGYTFRYTLMLEQAADRYDFFALGNEGRFMAFRWEHGSITLYDVGAARGEGYGTPDFSTPLAVLRVARVPAVLASN
jgi:hypothetical protein